MPLVPSGGMRRAVLLGLPAAVGACALTFDARSLGVPATMASRRPWSRRRATRSRITHTAAHLFWGLYQMRGPHLRNALANQLGEGTGIANLRGPHVPPAGPTSSPRSSPLGLVAPTSVTTRGHHAGTALRCRAPAASRRSQRGHSVTRSHPGVTPLADRRWSDACHDRDAGLSAIFGRALGPGCCRRAVSDTGVHRSREVRYDRQDTCGGVRS